MKSSHHLLCLLVILFSTAAGAQTPAALPESDKKTTTVARNDATGTTVTTDEFKSPDGTLHGYRVTTVNAFGYETITDSITTPGGKPWRVTTIRRNGEKQVVYAEERNYDDKGNTVLEYQKREFNDYIVKVTLFKAGKEKTVTEYSRSTEPGPLSPMHPDRDKDLPDHHKVELFGGYSYLNSESTPDNISYPIGAHIIFNYLLAKNWAILADLSYHSKKDNDLKLARWFAMGGFQYMFVRIQQKRQKELLMFARLMAGLAAEREHYTFGGAIYKDQYKAWAIAAGLGLAYPINSSIFLQVIPDYILTHFNDETQGNIRVSVGVKIDVRRKIQP